ncbi:MAG TPA: hypothetical protein VHC49_19390 [Mycobacteriales bacterium]|nr:hypothetical protein [Mycobacteriales bacterium]
MLSVVARLMMTMGTALLFLALIIRLAPLTPANAVGDDLAIIASALVIVVGFVCGRRAPKDSVRSKEE